MSWIKDSAKSLLSIGLLRSSHTRVILMHHDVSSPADPQHSPLYSSTPERFRAQIEYMMRYFEFVDLEGLFGAPGEASAKPLASLTFDDGFCSVKEHAWPFLAKHKIPFTVFVSADAMRRNALSYSSKYSELNRSYDRKVYLSEEDVIELDRAGVRVGNHSVSHPVLSECDAPTLEKEVAGNQKYLQDVLGKPIRHFAIPYGKASHYNSEVIAASRRSGHEYVYSSNPAPFRLGAIDPRTDLVPRIGLTNETERDLRFLINRALFKKIDL